MRNPGIRLALFSTLLVAPSAAAHAARGPFSAAGATSPARIAIPVAPRGDDESSQPDRRRLLQLADGRVLRARSRFEDGGWQVRQGRDWVPLEGEVVGHRLEREAVGEARARLAQLGRDDLDGIVAAASWMLDEGLEEEAVEALGRALAREREHAGALALIEARPIELELDGAPPRGSVERLRALLAAGARGPAAESEIAVRRVAEFDRLTDLVRLVEIELAHPNYHHRGFAVLMARRLFPGELLEELVDRALLDSYEEVRERAALALGGAREVGVLAPMIRALSSENKGLRLHAIEAMGRMGYPAAVEPLMVHLNFLQDSGGPPVGTRANLYIGMQTAIVSDYDVEIAQGASIADPIVGVVESGVVFDVRAVAHITRTVEERAVVSALSALTEVRRGRSIDGAGEKAARAERTPSSPSEWLAWWERERSSWRGVDLAAD